MKIVNMNEYNENDGLRNKLRQRMDNHEPELSDSVWDRIHHEMDQRDASRKKRFLWLFSSVAMVLLTSGVLTFLALRNNDAQNTVVQNTVVTTPSGQAENPAVNDNTNTTAIEQETANVLSDATDAAENYTTNNGTNTVTVVTSAQPSTAGGGNTPSLETTATQGENTPAAPSGTTDNHENSDKNIVEEPNNVTEKPAVIETEENPVIPTESDTKQVEVDEPEIEGKEEDKKEANPAATKNENGEQKEDKFKRWFIGAIFSYNQTYRTVNDISNSIAYPNAEHRNAFEKKSYSPSYGIELGFYPAKNFFIKSGVGIFNISEDVHYNINKRQSGAPLFVIYGNEEDSIAEGSNVKVRNTYKYIQVPLEVGYSRSITPKVGLFIGGGVALNILQNYNYNYYEAFYGNAVIPSEAAESPKNMYNNYLMVSGTFGLNYSFNNMWGATIGINYKKAVTNSANKEYAVDVRPYAIGATMGLAYKF